jgi:drug/metabolite transporter (DMT)-like permease
MNKKLLYGIYLHILIFVLAFTGILGKLITVTSSVLVFYRLLFGLVALAGFIFFTKKFVFISDKKDLAKILATGAVIGAHWICFFESIKQSTVSIGLIALSTATLFAAILEPLFFKRKFRFYELLFGILIITGILIVFNYEPGYSSGLIIGIFAAFFGALFTVLNGKFVEKYPASRITLYELFGGFILVSIYSFLNSNSLADFYLTPGDLTWLLFLGIVCTAIAFVGSIEVMKEISPFTVTLSFNLEPVYGIFLALFLFGEEEKMSPQFYLGALLILGTIFTNAWIKGKNKH